VAWLSGEQVELSGPNVLAQQEHNFKIWCVELSAAAMNFVNSLPAAACHKAPSSAAAAALE